MDPLELLHVSILPCGASARIFKRGLEYIPQVVSKCGKLTISTTDEEHTKDVLSSTRWLLQNIDRVIITEADYDDLKELIL